MITRPIAQSITQTIAARGVAEIRAGGIVLSGTVPGAPTIGATTAGNTTISQAFTAPASNGGQPITSYTATASPGGASVSGAASPLVIPGLLNGTAYTVTVTATNAHGSGPASAASASATPRTVPGAPTIGTATAGAGTASITFTAPASNGGSAITSYTLTSSPGGFTGTGAASPIVVSGLAAGTPYTFTATATNVAGTGAASAASNSATPTSAAPTFALTNAQGSLSGNVAGFEIYRDGSAKDRGSVTSFDRAGQWVATNRTATVGDAYEVIFTVISGTVSASSTLASGVAGRLNVDQVFYLSSVGSFTVAIRPFGGGTNVASATFDAIV